MVMQSSSVLTVLSVEVSPAHPNFCHCLIPLYTVCVCVIFIACILVFPNLITLCYTLVQTTFMFLQFSMHLTDKDIDLIVSEN